MQTASLAAFYLFFSQATSVLTGLYIAKTLGATEYGVVNIVSRFLALGIIICPIGIDLAIQRYINSNKGPIGTLLGTVTILRIIVISGSLLPVFASAFGLARFLEQTVYKFNDFALICVLIFAALPFAVDSELTSAVYRALSRPLPGLFASCIIQPTTRTIIVVILFAVGWRLWAVIIATVAATVLSWIFLVQRSTKDVWKAASKGKWPDAQEVLMYAPVLGASVALAAITRSTDTLMLGSLVSPAVVGVYGVVLMMCQLIGLIATAFGQTLGGEVAKLFATDDKEGIGRLLSETARHISLVSAPIFAGIILWGDRVDLILGPSYTPSFTLLALSSLTQIVLGVSSYSGFALSMTGKHVSEAIVLGGGLILQVTFCQVLIPSYGAEGAAFATFIALALTNFARVAWIWRNMHIIPVRPSVIPPILISLIIGGLVHGIGNYYGSRDILSTIVTGTIFIGLYMAAVYGMLLTPVERCRVLALFRRGGAN